MELKPNGPTLGQMFQRAGNHTGDIGRWHVYGSPDGNYGRRLAAIPREKRFGFDYWKTWECTHEYNHSSLYYEECAAHDNSEVRRRILRTITVEKRL